MKEVEMANSVGDLETTRSIRTFETHDARNATALKKISKTRTSKKKVHLRVQRAQKEDRFHRGRQIA